MAGGYSSDDSYDEAIPKQSRSSKKESRNLVSFNSISTPTPGKQSKEKNSPGATTFSIPELLCECQQKCTERVTAPLIQKVCMYFKALPNRNSQYVYLSKIIQIKVKHFSGDEKTTKGKPFRKMGYRYFVPILTDDDMKRQIDERKITEEMSKVAGAAEKKSPDKLKKCVAGNDVFPDWDHIEVCLNAFTSIHVISEKRVTITRATHKLQTQMRCSRPFSGYVQANGLPHAPIKKKIRLEDASGLVEDVGKKKNGGPAPDVCRLAAEWLAQQASAAMASKPAFAINPKTLLPEGLVLPASVTCLPLFTGPALAERDHGRDIDIVDNFFADQLWKPEYIGGVP